MLAAFNRSLSLIGQPVKGTQPRPKCHSEVAHTKATEHSRAVQWWWGIAPTRPAEEYSRVDGELPAKLPDTGCNRQKRTVSDLTQLGSSS